MSDSLHGVHANALFEGEGPIRVVPWPDPVADASGFAAASAMVEWCWLPVVGPSGAWAYRRLVSALAANHGAYDQDLAELAHWLGLGAGVSPNAPVSRTLLRLVRFGLAAVPSDPHPRCTPHCAAAAQLSARPPEPSPPAGARHPARPAPGRHGHAGG